MKKIPVMLTIRGEQHYRGQEPDMVEPVSYTHLTLPTKLEE